MSSLNCVKVAKRDGSVEPFNLAKLRNSLSLALEGAGADAELAEPLAKAVADYLEHNHDRPTITSGYLHRCALSALSQTNLRAAARQYSGYRRWRSAQRKRVRIFDPQKPDCQALRWRKKRLVCALRQRYELREQVARFLSGRIEERILGLGYSAVTGALVNELTRNEVLAWGLADGDAPTPTDDWFKGPTGFGPASDKN